MHSAFQNNANLFMCLEFCNGGEFFFYIKNLQKFSENATRFYAANIFLGLKALHEHRIVYRDLKPENVLMGKDGYLKITDFGMAKENVDDTSGAKTFWGTPAYLAPEVIEGKEYGRAADWWSFGCILYEMLVGLPPFYSENRKIMFNNILYHEPDFPESLSAEVVDLMEKLLEKDPKERLGSFSENCEGIVQHKWFEVIDFDSIASKSMKPPFIPDMSKDGLNYFDEEFTSTNIQPQIDDFSFGNSLDSTDDFFSDFDFQMTEDTE